MLVPGNAPIEALTLMDRSRNCFRCSSIVPLGEPLWANCLQISTVWQPNWTNCTTLQASDSAAIDSILERPLMTGACRDGTEAQVSELRLGSPLELRAYRGESVGCLPDPAKASKLLPAQQALARAVV